MLSCKSYFHWYSGTRHVWPNQNKLQTDHWIEEALSTFLPCKVRQHTYLALWCLLFPKVSEWYQLWVVSDMLFLCTYEMQIYPKLYSTKMSDTKTAQQRLCKAEHWNLLCSKLPQCQNSLRVGHVYLILLTAYKDNIVLFNKIFFLKLWWSQSSVKANYWLNSSTLLPTASKQEYFLLSSPIFPSAPIFRGFSCPCWCYEGVFSKSCFSTPWVWHCVKTDSPTPTLVCSVSFKPGCSTAWLSNNLPLQQMHWP